ncbi:hypothetical protein [Sporocytophaga myxococcoides]|uniref:hypothetical protein n=1 Tax=Sporocytophaga myxococcoides TaxID=153721 RepID=UPI0003FF3EFE|nr:hypothetical protein [Sporocytophaga myxococcoides]
MTTEKIINEITSGDSQKVWSSACEIISLGQEPDRIKPLIPFLTKIKEMTKGLEMGGAFASNMRFVHGAIRTIEFYKSEKGCPCSLFGIHDCMDPNKEEAKGYLKIIDRKLIDERYVDFYIALCTRCGQKFSIIERDYHYTWWGWTRF